MYWWGIDLILWLPLRYIVNRGFFKYVFEAFLSNSGGKSFISLFINVNMLIFSLHNSLFLTCIFIVYSSGCCAAIVPFIGHRPLRRSLYRFVHWASVILQSLLFFAACFVRKGAQCESEVMRRIDLGSVAKRLRHKHTPLAHTLPLFRFLFAPMATA